MKVVAEAAAGVDGEGAAGHADGGDADGSVGAAFLLDAAPIFREPFLERQARGCRDEVERLVPWR